MEQSGERVEPEGTFWSDLRADLADPEFAASYTEVERTLRLRQEAVEAVWATGLFGCDECPDDGGWCVSCVNDIGVVVDTLLALVLPQFGRDEDDNGR